MSDPMFTGSMKPIILLPKGAVGPEGIALLNDNGICTVECEDPAAVKFLDPIPSAALRSRVEDAAVELSRRLLKHGEFANINQQLNSTTGGTLTRGDVARLYVDILTKGTPLDPNPTDAERYQPFFDQAKVDEYERLGREEAKAERAAAKAAKSKPATVTQQKS